MFPDWSSTKRIFLSKYLNLISCHGNRNAKFAKKKILRNYKGDTAESCIIVHSISLYKIIDFLLPFFKYFGCYDIFKLH